MIIDKALLDKVTEQVPSCQGTGTWQQPRSSVLPSLVLTGKRHGEDRSFSGAFVVFWCICAFFSRVLFGGKEFFRIFASKKNGTGFIRFTLFLIYL